MPYEVATTGDVRDAFRRFRSRHECAWSWSAARVPSGMSEAEEAACEEAARIAAKEKKRLAEKVRTAGARLVQSTGARPLHGLGMTVTRLLLGCYTTVIRLSHDRSVAEKARRERRRQEEAARAAAAAACADVAVSGSAEELAARLHEARQCGCEDSELHAAEVRVSAAVRTGTWPRRLSGCRLLRLARTVR